MLLLEQVLGKYTKVWKACTLTKGIRLYLNPHLLFDCTVFNFLEARILASLITV